MKTLKIYIIDDDIRRYKIMATYFEAVKADITSERINEGFTELLKQSDIGKIDLHHIREKTTPSGELDFLNYSYDEDFEDYIKKLLNDDSPRFFLLDLALNKQERDVFSRNENMLVPYVARQIVDLIGRQSSRKELIVVNTRCTNLSRRLEKVLDIKSSVKKMLDVKIISANIFAPTYVREQKDIILGATVKDLLEGLKKNG